MQWQDRVAVLATMHQKEQVIAPILQEELGIKVIVPTNFNTDIFGTFTRDIERTGNQIEAARLKAEKILEQTRESIAIASEGSFAPHPAFPYVTSNREIIILIDKENDLEIIGEEFSIDTNHNHLVVKNIEQALKFAKKIGFPEHGLIAMSEEFPKDSSKIFKGIITEKQLVEAINYVITKSSTGTVHLETDMRAMFNPTRMKNIAKATRNLVKKINSSCPKCHTPGFEIIQRIEGLPCELCYAPTSLTRAVIYECKRCGYSEEKLFPDGKEFAEPSLCIYCNP
ncbi:MAG: hypothetical protein KME64_17130 [Scytonematopsis contorta HA4267-MV1]|jgi:predicted Zn-ribbon and HTH transcriptional regulator|nr:hypothetical protein [Scytonematopsis contorta HA4267-MV1]